MKLALMLPAAVLAAAVGWLGYRVFAPPRPPLPAGSVVISKGDGRTIVLKRERPPRRHFNHRSGEAPGQEPAPAKAPIAARAAAAEAPVGETLPNGEPRPINVVRGTPEEMAVHKLLTPLVERRKDAGLSFVRCDSTPAPVASDEEAGPLETPPRDPKQPICLARIQARDKDTLRDILRDANATYKGHFVAQVREHLDGYTGRWFQADVRVDTDDTYPPPELSELSSL